jgi:hypothetical protein
VAKVDLDIKEYHVFETHLHCNIVLNGNLARMSVNTSCGRK